MEALGTGTLDEVQAALTGVGDVNAPVALQSTVAVARETILRVLTAERAAEAAALSLAQRELLADLRSELEEAEAALTRALTDRGRRVLGSAESPKTSLSRRLGWRRSSPPPMKWDEALSSALESMDAGVDLLTALASGQPQDTTARKIAQVTARLLSEHHSALEGVSARWLR
jgi:hypothetical protein